MATKDKNQQMTLELLRRIAAGERLLMVFRWWMPFQQQFLEWDGKPQPTTEEAERLYKDVRSAGKRGWVEPQKLGEDRQLIVLTDAGRDALKQGEPAKV
jgi:hypothetical protein